jgi:hypothetical protein
MDDNEKRGECGVSQRAPPLKQPVGTPVSVCTKQRRMGNTHGYEHDNNRQYSAGRQRDIPTVMHLPEIPPHALDR